MITAAAVAPSTVHSLKCPPLIGPRGAPGGAARARTLAEGTLQLRQSPLQAIPGLGLGLLVLAPFEVAQRRVVGGPRVAHAALELLAGQPLLDGQGGHGAPPSAGSPPILPLRVSGGNRNGAQRHMQYVRRPADACGSVPADLLESPLAHAEFLVVDTETNGKAGEACELTEIGAVLVGGGELHERYESLVGVRAPLGRGIQRFTGITQAMVDEAPAAELVLPDLVAQLDGRVLVGHNVAFDRRVLRQACERAGLAWPDPPSLCTVALARRFAPLARQRRLAALADALGVEVETTHRALADAETCARVFCALFPKLCMHAVSIRDAIAALRPLRPARRRAGATDGGREGARRARSTRRPDVGELPDDPGVYLFRNACGQVLYVGKSVSLRTRARAHFAPSVERSAWTAQAEVVDFQATQSELGALVLENRLVKRLAPPGNVRLKHQDRYVYLRCRLDIAYPVLEVAPSPAAGHAVSVGPLRGRAATVELLEQLNSLFRLRHCGRTLKRRYWPSAYGQMGRCMSPCLGDLDPNAYRRRLDEALALFTGRGDG